MIILLNYQACDLSYISQIKYGNHNHQLIVIYYHSSWSSLSPFHILYNYYFINVMTYFTVKHNSELLSLKKKTCYLAIIICF